MKRETASVYRNIGYLLVSGIFFLLSVTAASAKTVSYVKEYSYQASELDSKLSSRTVAMEQVKRLLLEELGTYLISETEVKDFQLTTDRISSLTAGIVMTVILEETWDGKTYFLKAKITTDTDELVKSIDRIRGNQEESKNWEEMKKKTEEALKEIEKLKREIGSGRAEKISEEKYAKTVNELNAMDWYKRGYRLRFNEKNNQEAMKAFDKAVEIDPSYAKAYAGRAAIYNERGEYQKGLRESEQAIKLDPNLPWGFHCRGWAYNGLRNYAKAIEDFNRAIELEPKYAWAYTFRSTSYYWLAKHQRALEDANKAIELAPRLAFAYFNRGRSLASLNNIQDALKDYDRAIELDPMYSWYFVFRANAFLKLNKTEQALEDFKKAASLGNDVAQDYLKKKGIQW